MDETQRLEPTHAHIAPIPLSGFTGRGITVTVIDSGVHPAHDHIAADRLGSGVMVLSDGAIIEGDGVWLDQLGHGTAVTAAIQEKAPDALCLPVRVFRESLKTSAAALVAAMRWSIACKVDVINLSLGSVNEAHRPVFAAVVEEAVAAGIVVVAAREADGAPCYPGALEHVIGVELDWDCPRISYGVRWSGAMLVSRASGYPRPIVGVPPRRNLYGISFAVAQMSGFVARACESLAVDDARVTRAEQVRDLLHASACR